MASISLHKLRKGRVFKAEPFTKFNVNHCLVVNTKRFLKLMLDDVSCNEFPQCLDCASYSFKNPEREPSIAGAPSMQIPTTFSQLKPSVVKKV